VMTEMYNKNSESCFFEVENLCKDFGGLRAVNNVSFEVKKNEIFSIIGPNGAGKTTLFNLISGFFQIRKGSISFRGKRLNNLSPFLIARLGVARTFQNIRLFPDMNVIENVLIGSEAKAVQGFLATGFRVPGVQKLEKEKVENAEEWLNYLGLLDYKYKRSGSLPYLLQKKLEIARALANDPALILLDEPGAGLNDVEIGEIQEIIWRIRDELGLTILVIDHNTNLIMSLSDSIMVLNFGEILTIGSPEDVRNDSRVIAAYLGH